MVGGFFISIVTIILLKDTYPVFYEKLDFFSSGRIELYRLALNEVKTRYSLSLVGVLDQHISY